MNASPAKPQARPRRDIALAAGAGAGALGVYLLTLAPTVTSEDAGELITAATTLGVPHPPGFPLWVLLVHGLITVSPAGAAWTANLSSALFGAVTVGATVVLARRLGVSRLAAVVAGLLLGFGQTFWSQAVIAEVYTLNTALLAIALAAIVAWGQPPDGRDRGLWLAAFACGLGLANHHPLTLLAGPAFAVYALWRGGRGLLTPRRLLPVLGCVAAPALLYLYLPWAAAQSPPVNWGQPVDAESLWFHVSRQAYSELERGADVTLADKLAFGRDFLGLWLREWTPWTLLVGGLAGAWALRRRPEAALLGGVIVMNSLVLLSILRFEFEPENIMRVNEYYLPTYVATAAVVAIGLQAILHRLGEGPRARVAQGIVALLPLGPLALNWHDNDQSDYRLAEDFNRYTLESLPPDSVYFPSGDYVSFPSLYLQAVEGLRPDVLLANYTGEPAPELLAYLHEIAPEAGEMDRAKMQRLLLERSARPVIFASKSDVRVPGLDLTPWGLVYRAWRPGEARAPGPDIRNEPILRHFETPTAVDDLGRSVIADYQRALAEAHLRVGDREGALAAFEAAERWLERSKEGLNNLGSTLAEYGFLEQAERLYRKAAALSPKYVTPRRNLAIMLDRQGRRDDAIAAFEALVRAAPEDDGARRRLAELKAPPAQPSPAETRVAQFEAATRAEPHRAPLWNNLGTAYVEAGRPEDAREAYLEAVRRDPGYAMAHKHLAALYREFLGDEEAARRHQAQYEALSRTEP